MPSPVAMVILICMFNRFIPLLSLCVLAFAVEAETPSGNTFATHVVAEGLVVPWDMEFAPDGVFRVLLGGDTTKHLRY